MKIPGMLRISGGRKQSPKKGAVKTKTHKRAEQNLQRRKDRPREESWFSPKTEEGRSRARARNNDAQMDIERRVTMLPAVHSWKRGMMRRYDGSMGKLEQLAIR
jgi:hypothetical protein